MHRAMTMSFPGTGAERRCGGGGKLWISSNQPRPSPSSKPVVCLATSADGFQVLSGSEDGTVRVWDAASCQTTKIYHHQGLVWGELQTASQPSSLFVSDGWPTPVLPQPKKGPVSNLAIVPRSWVRQHPPGVCWGGGWLKTQNSFVLFFHSLSPSDQAACGSTHPAVLAQNRH